MNNIDNPPYMGKRKYKLKEEEEEYEEKKSVNNNFNIYTR